MIRPLMILALCAVGYTSPGQTRNNLLWYKKPAEIWTEALPVGNGTMGGMVYGGIDTERIALNEATLWSGGPIRGGVNPDAQQYLPALRKALFAEQFDSADVLARKMQGVYSESYLPLGDLYIYQRSGMRAVAGTQNITGYRRQLDIRDAVATTSWTRGGIQFKREIFVSHPDEVMIIRLTSSRPGALNILVQGKSQLHEEALAGRTYWMMGGKAPAHVDPSYVNYNSNPIIYDDADSCRGMKWAMIAGAATKDGRISAGVQGLVVEGASEIDLYVTMATGFKGYDQCPAGDANAIALSRLKKAMAKGYNTIKQRQVQDVRHYFDRVSLELGGAAGERKAGPDVANEEKADATSREKAGQGAASEATTGGANGQPADLPTDERLAAYTAGGSDPGLEALYFQYGRYLLISSSRTPGAPANLQGIWNKELRAPWSSNYTTNINVQMNYWLAEPANLSELTSPLFDLIGELSVRGQAAAKEFYGASGWVTHHNSDIWALSTPVGDKGKGEPKWANWPMGGAWLVRHLWEHYLYTGDKQFLRDTALPLMKGAADFMLDWLVPDEKGELVTAPSMSPENDFIYGNNKVGDVSIATTMDMGIIRDLFDNLLAADQILGIGDSARLHEALARLYPYKIGAQGQLQEWYKDYASPDPHHRHVSHLYSLYPANEISALKTPGLAAAAKRSLILRGDEGTGWSMAWKVNFWARLQDGDHAYQLFKHLLRLTRENGTRMNGGGGAYPNLFDAHPPFQIDGNFGGAAGLAEMLLQSQDGDVHLLPALPQAWQEGKVRGLVARGGFVVDESWTSNRLQTAEIQSRRGGACVVRSAEPLVVKGGKERSKKGEQGYMLTLQTVAGGRYELLSAGK